MGLNCWKVKT